MSNIKFIYNGLIKYSKYNNRLTLHVRSIRPACYQAQEHPRQFCVEYNLVWASVDEIIPLCWELCNMR